MSKKAYIETLTNQEIKRGKYGKTPHQALLISIPKITLMEYKNLCKIEDISQSKILVGLIKDFIEIKKLSER
jgi:hypothetical protein